MNFFKLYIGDYQRDTAHLSIAEHGAYLLMLQHYYATEKPLPAGKALHRMLRAQDKSERDAIDAVAERFWRTTADGLVNDRCDREIKKASAQAETNAGIAREREAKRKAAREAHGKSTNRATNEQPNQTPDTRHQTNPQHPATSTGGGAGDSDSPPEPSMAGIVCGQLRRLGIADTNPGHPSLLALLEAGAQPSEFAAFADKAKGKSSPFAYLLRAVASERESAAQMAGKLHQGAMPAPAATTREQRQAATVRAWMGAALQPQPDEVTHAAPAALR